MCSNHSGHPRTSLWAKHSWRFETLYSLNLMKLSLERPSDEAQGKLLQCVQASTESLTWSVVNRADQRDLAETICMVYSHVVRGGQRISASIFLRKAWRSYSCRGDVTLNAAQFQRHWEDEGPTAHPYNWHPLAQLDSPRRGAVIENWARRMLQGSNPSCVVEDAVPGTCANGKLRGRNRAEYDFLCDGRRVEIKSSQLLHKKGRWWVYYCGIGFQPSIPSACLFDDLYLVIFSPKWIHLLKHDLQTGMSKSGSHVTVSGKDGTWEESLDVILDKLCEDGRCEFIGKTDISDSWIADECEQHVSYISRFYHRKPFSAMSPSLRGHRVERLVQEIDQLLHPESDFSRPTRSVDWIRDKTRVEAKSGQLNFCQESQRWFCEFWNVNRDYFDELLVAVYSPRGLDVFRHDGTYGARQTSVIVRASAGEFDPLRALKQIEEQLEANNCPKVASILWDDWQHFSAAISTPKTICHWPVFSLSSAKENTWHAALHWSLTRIHCSFTHPQVDTVVVAAALTFATRPFISWTRPNHQMLPSNFHAFHCHIRPVRTSKDSTFRDFAQGAYRLRGIRKGQRLQVLGWWMQKGWCGSGWLCSYELGERIDKFSFIRAKTCYLGLWFDRGCRFFANILKQPRPLRIVLELSWILKLNINIIKQDICIIYNYILYIQNDAHTTS